MFLSLTFLCGSSKSPETAPTERVCDYRDFEGGGVRSEGSVGLGAGEGRGYCRIRRWRIVHIPVGDSGGTEDW